MSTLQQKIDNIWYYKKRLYCKTNKYKDQKLKYQVLKIESQRLIQKDKL